MTPARVTSGCSPRDLPVGRYSVWVRLTDDVYITRYAESGLVTADVVAGDTADAPPVDIQVDHAYYTVGWHLHAHDGTAITCGQVAGVSGVAITATTPGGVAFDTVVPCEQGLAPAQTNTRPLPSTRRTTRSGSRRSCRRARGSRSTTATRTRTSGSWTSSSRDVRSGVRPAQRRFGVMSSA